MLGVRPDLSDDFAKCAGQCRQCERMRIFGSCRVGVRHGLDLNPCVYTPRYENRPTFSRHLTASMPPFTLILFDA